MENNIGAVLVEPKVKKPEIGIKSLTERFAGEKRKLTASVMKTIGRFKRLKVENPTVDLKEEEKEMMDLSMRYDDLSAHAEAEFDESGNVIETKNSESHDQEIEDEISLQALFDITPSRELREGYKEIKEKFSNQFITEEEKQKFYSKTLFPNRFTKEEAVIILNKISDKIKAEPEQERKDLYKELYDLISERGYIFPEFSHGSCAISVNTMLAFGILPGAQIPQNAKFKGEGPKVNPARGYERDDAMYAGFGRKGLFLAMGYAKRHENPFWNSDVVMELNTLSAVAPPDETKVNDNEYQQQRYKIYMDAYKEAVKNGNTWLSAIENYEYPVVLGFSGTKNIESADSDYYGLRDNDRGMPGEIFLGPDKVPKEKIEIVACPKKKIVDMQGLIEDHGRADVRVISIEALDLLPELGIDYQYAEKFALEYRSVPERSVADWDRSWARNIKYKREHPTQQEKAA